MFPALLYIFLNYMSSIPLILCLAALPLMSKVFLHGPARFSKGKIYLSAFWCLLLGTIFYQDFSISLAATVRYMIFIIIPTIMLWKTVHYSNDEKPVFDGKFIANLAVTHSIYMAIFYGLFIYTLSIIPLGNIENYFGHYADLSGHTYSEYKDVLNQILVLDRFWVILPCVFSLSYGMSLFYNLSLMGGMHKIRRKLELGNYHKFPEFVMLKLPKWCYFAFLISAALCLGKDPLFATFFINITLILSFPFYLLGFSYLHVILSGKKNRRWALFICYLSVILYLPCYFIFVIVGLLEDLLKLKNKYLLKRAKRVWGP